jgi:glutathione S-transferase
MEGRLENTQWLASDEYSLADVNTYSMVAGVPHLVPEAMSPENTPRTIAWRDKMNARPAVQRALAMSRMTTKEGEG